VCDICAHTEHQYSAIAEECEVLALAPQLEFASFIQRLLPLLTLSAIFVRCTGCNSFVKDWLFSVSFNSLCELALCTWTHLV